MEELQQQLIAHGEAEIEHWKFHGSMAILYDTSASLANSTVYRGSATNKETEDGPVSVAVKVVSLKQDEQSIAMIKQECKILRLVGFAHPHILRMLHCWESAVEVVILAPLAPDGDLSKLVHMGVDCIEELEARRLTLQIMSALSYVHGKAIIHGDVAPNNVLLTKSGDDGAFLVQLCDFGLSIVVPAGEEAVASAGVRGTYGYIPVEVIQRKPISYAVDLFALGVLTFRIVGGHDPFYPPSKVHLPLEFDSACWNPVSLAARAFVTQLLAVDSAARGTSAIDGHEWLVAEEAALIPPEPRGPMAPTPLSDVHFKRLERTA
jgi:serine/threonine protein kinase